MGSRLAAPSAPIPALFKPPLPPDGIPEELHCPALFPVESHPPPIRPSWALSQRTRATACVYKRLRRFELRAKSKKTLDLPVHVLRYSRERHFDLLSVACGSQLRKVPVSE